MAAATMVPGGSQISKTFVTDLINAINIAVSSGIFATTDLVSAALTNLATDQAAR